MVQVYLAVMIIIDGHDDGDCDDGHGDWLVI
jgi:hypothetical protein